jgi:hypothetical protein
MNDKHVEIKSRLEEIRKIKAAIMDMEEAALMESASRMENVQNLFHQVTEMEAKMNSVSSIASNIDWAALPSHPSSSSSQLNYVQEEVRGYLEKSCAEETTLSSWEIIREYRHALEIGSISKSR